MSEKSDYFYRRNKSVEERLLRGDKPNVIANDYSMSLAMVEAMFPECNYRMFCRAVKRRFAMGETSYEIAKILELEHKLILTVLDVSFSKESIIYAILRMYDNGFSIPNIKKVTHLEDSEIRDVLEKTGRNQESMRYYKVLGKKFSFSINTDNWLHEVCKDVTEFAQPMFLMEMENRIESKYQKKAQQIYQDIASEELEHQVTYDDQDHDFAEKLIKKLQKMYGITRKRLVTKAILYFAKSVGVINTGGGLGGKDVTRMKNEMQSEIDQYYLSMAEIKNTKMKDMQKSYFDNL